MDTGRVSPTKIFNFCGARSRYDNDHYPVLQTGFARHPFASEGELYTVLYDEIKNLCHYRVGGNRGGITAHIVRQINVYKFYRPCSCLRRNDKKVVVAYLILFTWIAAPAARNDKGAFGARMSV